MLGQVGEKDGASYIEYLTQNKVNTDCIVKLENIPTGQAYIHCYPDGDNSILIVGGANQAYPE